jgi:hypothetical protein
MLAVLLACVAAAGVAGAQPTVPESNRKTPDVGTHAEIATLTLVRTVHAAAVVRFGSGPLEKISIGDRLGTTRAEVKEIVAGRLVLEETFTGKDGRPNRARIVLKDGETGGTRYLRRLDEPPLVGVKPIVVDPKPAPKKP